MKSSLLQIAVAFGLPGSDPRWCNPTCEARSPARDGARLTGSAPSSADAQPARGCDADDGDELVAAALEAVCDLRTFGVDDEGG
jgi:hypothetical protein